jgi:uncharacterized protein YkwD
MGMGALLYFALCMSVGAAEPCKCGEKCPCAKSAACRPSAPSANAAVASKPPASICDKSGFGQWLNSTRQKHGLPCLKFDLNLSNHAAANNAIMARVHRSGHYAANLGWWSCAMWGVAGPVDAGLSFMRSAPHRAALLRSDVTLFGVHFDGVASWTVNLR